MFHLSYADCFDSSATFKPWVDKQESANRAIGSMFISLFHLSSHNENKARAHKHIVNVVSST